MEKIPLGPLRYITIVVPDVKVAARNHAAFYGINRWEVTKLTPDRLENVSIRGRVPTSPPPLDLAGTMPIPGAFGFISARGSSESGSINVQLVEPISGLSTFEEFLVTRGSGVHSFSATIVNEREFVTLRDWLATEGVPLAQSCRYGGEDHYFFDMRKPLANFFVEVVVPAAEPQALVPDEVWDFSSDDICPPDVRAAHNAAGFTHLGVVVENLQETLPNFAHLFGHAVWRGMHWRTAPGSLEETTNNGVAVHHGYFTGRADLTVNPSGLPFGFEVIQPTYGPSHYKEDFLRVLGPGIHHVDVRVPAADWDEWLRTNAWLEDAFDAPTCMSGWLRNKSALFRYKDTRRRLGYVVEISAPRRDSGPRVAWAPDYWYDFSATTAARV